MLASCLKQLEKSHFRLTKNREVLLQVLHQASRPLSPPEIVMECHRHERRMNKTTVYRELELLVGIGLVKRVMVSDRKQYFELSERGHHHHLVCGRCESIEDIVVAREDQLLKQGQLAAQKKGFSILEHSVEFFGLCRQCA